MEAAATGMRPAFRNMRGLALPFRTWCELLTNSLLLGGLGTPDDLGTPDRHVGATLPPLDLCSSEQRLMTAS